MSLNLKKNSEFDEELLGRMRDILTVISCGFDVRIEAFKEFWHQTAHLWAEKYSWYYMPISLHIVLMHSWRVIKELGLPAGLFSEEAIESTHKYVKNSRLDHARKTSRWHIIIKLLQNQFWIYIKNKILSEWIPMKTCSTGWYCPQIQVYHLSGSPATKKNCIQWAR